MPTVNADLYSLTPREGEPGLDATATNILGCRLDHVAKLRRQAAQTADPAERDYLNRSADKLFNLALKPLERRWFDVIVQSRIDARNAELRNRAQLMAQYLPSSDLAYLIAQHAYPNCSLYEAATFPAFMTALAAAV